MDILACWILLYILLYGIISKIPILSDLLGILWLISVIELFIFVIINEVLNLKIKNEKTKILYRENAELVDIARNIYENNKTVFNKARSKYILSSIILISGFAIFSVVSTYIFLHEKLYRQIVPSIIFYGALMIGASMPIIFYDKLGRSYKTILSNNIMNNFLNYSKFKLNYYIDSCFFQKETNHNIIKEMKEEYLNANFQRHTYEYECEIEDYITGYYNDVYIQFMSADFHGVRYTSDMITGGKIRRSPIRWFNDWHIFLIIDKNISDKYIKFISKKTHNLDKLKQSSHCDFDTYFEMFETDAQDSDLISNLKNFVLDFRNKYKVNFDIVIKDKIYIKFYIGKIFNFKVFGNPIDEESIYKFHVITKFIEGILEVIN